MILGGLWSFNNCCLFIHKLAYGENPKDVNFHYADFWFQVHDLPSRFTSEPLARNLGNVMISFLDYDASSRMNVFSNFMRICVRLDIHQPIIGHSDSSSQKLLDSPEGELVKGWPEEIRAEVRHWNRKRSLQWRHDFGWKDNHGTTNQVESQGSKGEGSESRIQNRQNKATLWMQKKRLRPGSNSSIQSANGLGNPRAVPTLTELVQSNKSMAIFWNSTINVSIFGYSHNHIDVVIDETGFFDVVAEAWSGVPNGIVSTKLSNYVASLYQWKTTLEGNFSSRIKALKDHPSRVRFVRNNDNEVLKLSSELNSLLAQEEVSKRKWASYIFMLYDDEGLKCTDKV
ncbi:hypothetical protein Goshw_023814, partial [Gossypium schwendimanii]|nr:hypothetical protein [Gossypium schwendimanii]